MRFCSDFAALLMHDRSLSLSVGPAAVVAVDISSQGTVAITKTTYCISRARLYITSSYVCGCVCGGCGRVCVPGSLYVYSPSVLVR